MSHFPSSQGREKTRGRASVLIAATQPGHLPNHPGSRGTHPGPQPNKGWMDLSAYGAMATAAVLMAPTVKAQVSYTDVDPDLLIANSSVDIDIDADGVPDLRISAVSSSGWVDVEPLGDNAVAGFYQPCFFSGGIVAKDLEFGESIDEMQSWTYNTARLVNYSPGCLGGWSAVGEHFLGIRLNQSDTIRYGWMRIRISGAYEAFVEDFAIENSPSNPLLAGDMTGVCSIRNHISTELIGPTQVLLSWEGGLFTDFYRVYFKAADDPSFSFVNVEGLSTEISGLAPGTAYSWYLQARCSEGGLLPPSPLQHFNTPNEPPFSISTRKWALGTPGFPITGVESNTRFGGDIAAIGDLNGDGISEIAVGTEPNGGPGGYWIFFPDGSGGIGSFSFPGGGNGVGMCEAGDVNGDGIPDIVVGLPDLNTFAGAIQTVFLQADGSLAGLQLVNSTDPVIGPNINTFDRFGRAISNMGDLDGNGTDDLLVGAYSNSDGAFSGGSVFILLMDSTGRPIQKRQITEGIGSFTGDLQALDGFGYSVETLGDLNGDGIRDIAVGAWTDGSAQGAVYILFLQPDGTVLNHVKITQGEGGFSGVLDNNDFFGSSLASMGDIDGDGTWELAVGAFADDDGGTDAGAVWILSLNPDGTVAKTSKISITSDLNISGHVPGMRMGKGLAFLEDTNGDGWPELAVGAYFDNTGATRAGAVYLLDIISNPCPVPTGLSTDSVTSSAVALSWMAVPEAEEYQIQARRAGAASIRSFTRSAPFFSKTGLTPSRNYEWRVRSICASSSSPWSAWVPFSTPSPRESIAQHSLQISPNPARESLMVKGWEHEGTYSVRNSNGQIMVTGSIPIAQQWPIHTGNWPAGLYWLELNSDEQRQTTPFSVMP